MLMLAVWMRSTSAFHAAGLQYGPSYRQLQQAWSCEKRRGDGAWRGAVARLRQRLGSYELAVHPADLDGALQLGCDAAARWWQAHWRDVATVRGGERSA